MLFRKKKNYICTYTFLLLLLASVKVKIAPYLKLINIQIDMSDTIIYLSKIHFTHLSKQRKGEGVCSRKPILSASETEGEKNYFFITV